MSIFSGNDNAILVLSDGTFIEGKAFGFRGTVSGEIVFNTGITGYQEVLTDPSYFGQLITFTFPELGNTGVNPEDQESDSPSAKGVIARQVSCYASNWRSTKTFEQWLKDEKVVGICDVDTRALVRHLRSSGTMNAIISSENNASPSSLLNTIRQAPQMKGLNLTGEVTTKKPYKWNSLASVDFDERVVNQAMSPFNVVAIDFGIKRSILNRLVAHGCEVNVLPANTSFSEVMSFNPEGVFFSNGPGDPSSVKEGMSLAKRLIEEVDVPMFGICLGHQILGLALGGKTFKLAYGHRGLNHPCGKTGRIEITSQNHGFALDALSLDKDVVEITHLNLNDGTVAGIAMCNRPIFGIQYHPEASPGPHDADHHFSRFVDLMSERR
ncbi:MULTISPECIES: glutamine-hydrolyzing carbamoyl-phosphate synthase small subunit [Prochlorococcus]|uniref:Carbamoyl phosphate synthase small chain n=1 Tax=Prochlorococcus marinus (strain SARG / CCMP1375 / SS120) TaxID=167539 RepID=Q7VCJ5_PROMA|nr:MULTISPECIES: glutamine-hydrolyzing carbamoyl-phosphate synthase small subunit [Prochlorococcus]AAP99789.1 Carbamoylphosphate synthase small subunit [Prochlorococcus marinus subsp. marinus str. CCMP1375]KGG11866.1 Carbamoyl-phosphate synthase small chain [Prochlorococcus marinus str. LG]KGG21827.1 Carbamoyl-phosphate synthase small chain [Prochlorococcus marinus str. SS2]KGG23742.1 Carbamoyl-phosphate synthase small chain [Prochlorococcus marinus str. SS35]KGG32022.1 Carbamoyl-phosphate syn